MNSLNFDLRVSGLILKGLLFALYSMETWRWQYTQCDRLGRSIGAPSLVDLALLSIAVFDQRLQKQIKLKAKGMKDDSK